MVKNGSGKSYVVRPTDTSRSCIACNKAASFIDPCLIAYPVAEWQALEQRVRKLPRFDPAVVQLKRLLVSGATECPIDKNGRILIPPVLRQFAGLDREIIWAGMTDTIEIWSKDGWDHMFEQARGPDLPELKEALGKLGL